MPYIHFPLGKKIKQTNQHISCIFKLHRYSEHTYVNVYVWT